MIGDEQTELEMLREWTSEAVAVLKHGVELMPLDQLSQWSGVRSVMEAAPTPVEVGQVIVQEWNVVKTSSGRKYVANKPHELPAGARIISATPHEDDDFSYGCGRDHCRCMQ